MSKHPETTGNYETAVALADRLGLVTIPVIEGTKEPFVRWKRWQREMPSQDLFRFWFQGTRHNIALITNGLVVFDVDDVTKANLVLENCGDTPVKDRTPSGGEHWFFRARRGVFVGNHVDIKGVDIDIRAENGLALIPNSRTKDGEYAWLGTPLHDLKSLDDLPVAKVGWTRERIKRRALQSVELIDDADGMVRRARAYLACVEGAVAGQRGHDKTFRVACKLTHFPPDGFGLPFERAWPLLLEWNEVCDPPWSDKELEHKLQDALKKRT